MTHLVSRLIRWATGRARIEGATRSDLVDLTSADRRASSGVDRLAVAIRGVIYDGLCEGLTVEQMADRIEVLWEAVITPAEIQRLLYAELKRLTRVPVFRLSPRNHGRTVQMRADLQAAADAYERAYGRRPNTLMIPAALLKPDHVEAGDRESNRMELGVYARVEAKRRALARDFPGFARAYLEQNPPEEVKSPPAGHTEPEDRVWGPSPIRRAWRVVRLCQILKGLTRRHE